MNVFPIHAFKDNYIWSFTDKQNHAAVVDPGDASPVISYLQKNNLKLTTILLTHHHHDHSGGIADLLHYAPDVVVYGSTLSRVPTITNRVNDGDEVIIFSRKLQVMAIPGHTLDHVAFYDQQILFCGDTLFSAGCGRIFEGTPAQMYHSLNKLAQLDPATKIYCGHEYTLANLKFAHQVEPQNKNIADKIIAVQAVLQEVGCSLPSVLAEEKLINPFLRCQQADVISAVERHAQKKLTDAVEVFAHLRAWKNSFTG